MRVLERPAAVRSNLAWVALAIALASTPGRAGAMGAAGDPLEAVNRAVFALNGLLSPPLRAIGEAVGDVADPALVQALRNLSSNLAEPGAALGHLARGDVAGARLTLKRFLVNGVEGPLGLRDIAAAEGLPPRPANLKDVLCHFGVPPGPYLVVPLLGDTTVRGAFAQTATIGAAFAIFGDYYVGYRVMTYLLTDLAQPPPLQEVRFLHDGRPDPYAAVRARRQALEQSLCEGEKGPREAGRPPGGASFPAPPPIAGFPGVALADAVPGR